jgi:hypothetical protein
MDEYGRLMPAVNRFPSSANGAGFKPLAEYIHSKGLKFGIHIMRGIPRQAVEKNLPIKGTSYRASDVADKDNACRWNPDMWGVDTTKPGAQAYYDSIAELYASWGVDFIKADDMGSHLYQPAEMKALSQAIRKTGRPMVLSISPGPAPLSEAEFFEKYAQMWRISDDFWDDWKLLRQQFDYARDWAQFVGKNDTWPDADMLPFGKLRVTSAEGGGASSKFTFDEQQTVMTLWSIFRFATDIRWRSAQQRCSDHRAYHQRRGTRSESAQPWRSSGAGPRQPAGVDRRWREAGREIHRALQLGRNGGRFFCGLE